MQIRDVGLVVLGIGKFRGVELQGWCVCVCVCGNFGLMALAFRALGFSGLGITPNLSGSGTQAKFVDWGLKCR